MVHRYFSSHSYVCISNLMDACFEFQKLKPLRVRSHDGSSVMPYDEWYTPLLDQAGLGVVAGIVWRGLIPFNGPALTALVDRWRPETHSFHLPCGEMTITLQDIAMILGPPIRGRAVTGRIVSDG